MTRLYNRKSLKEKRRELRKESTFAEKLIWNEIRKKNTGFRFLRQYSIGNYIVDFYNPEFKLAVEIDGITHEQEEKIQYDISRQKLLEELGINFIRFKDDEIINNIENAIDKIKNKISELKSTTPPFYKGGIQGVKYRNLFSTTF